MPYPGPTTATRGTLYALWFAFLTAPVAYLVIGWILSRDAAPQPYPQAVLAAMLLFATGAVAVGVLAPDRVLRGALKEPADDAAILAAYQTARIIRWAAFESVGIAGLVLTVLTRQVLPVALGATIGIVLNALSRPDPDGALATWRRA